MIEALLVAGALVLVGVAGFMTALDSALAVTSTNDLEDLALAGKNSRSLARLAADRDAHDNAITFLRVLCDVAAVVLTSVAFSMMFESAPWGALTTVIVMAIVIYVVVASAPTSVGRRYARPLLTLGAPAIRFARMLFFPIAQPLAVASARVIPGARRRSFESEEQLLSIVDEAAQNSLIEDDDRELIHSVFDFTDQIVRAVMVPRTDMVTVDATASNDEAMEAFLTSGLSRLPVVDGEVDNVVGVLYLKDLVQHAYREAPGWRTSLVRAFVRQAVFVPEQMRAETLLQQMKADQVHVCLVVDEYGGIAGLVTLEDLIEELVGEIEDEYDPRSTEIVELPDGRYRVSASLALDEVGDLFGLDLEDDDVDSIGGLMAKRLGRMPQPGEQVQVHGLLLTGGASRGRGRGLATLFVDRTEALRYVEEARTAAIRVSSTTGEIGVHTGAVSTADGEQDSTSRRKKTSKKNKKGGRDE
ncbi:hemolysin family protein [Microbacterium amylolyticum]|uniref:CBS domain containing-hemolysin-like protein n=1 Tax=Microbacterium amylolyticum TaxID=936337 RepID=A0ABS4ZEC5_9MICO|nr:hemolysin family protein [Microbacterium amylolyticum]MBP2435643.1 CBS domain containing-hemolysin-like protein [Microbacterium amylolyticum]